MFDETIVTLCEAAAHVPCWRRGPKPHKSCMYRWSTTGCRGVVLETIQIGATRCTSIEALQRFFARLTQQRDRPSACEMTEPRQTRVPRNVDRELDARGL